MDHGTAPGEWVNDRTHGPHGQQFKARVRAGLITDAWAEQKVVRAD